MGRKTRNLVLSPLTTLPLTKITVLALLKKKEKSNVLALLRKKKRKSNVLALSHVEKLREIIIDHFKLKNVLGLKRQLHQKEEDRINSEIYEKRKHTEKEVLI